MKVMGNYVLIEPIKGENTKTESGLDLGEAHISDIRYRRARVIASGQDVDGLEVDDNVYYDRHAGFDMVVDKKTYKVIKQPDIIIVV